MRRAERVGALAESEWLAQGHPKSYHGRRGFKPGFPRSLSNNSHHDTMLQDFHRKKQANREILAVLILVYLPFANAERCISVKK